MIDYDLKYVVEAGLNIFKQLIKRKGIIIFEGNKMFLFWKSRLFGDVKSPKGG